MWEMNRMKLTNPVQPEYWTHPRVDTTQTKVRQSCPKKIPILQFAGIGLIQEELG